MKPLLLVGGGGHFKSVIDVAESTGFIIKGILDIPENVGKASLIQIMISDSICKTMNRL